MIKPKVAFICVHNSCRSQIAEALGRHLASVSFESYSAGTEPVPRINQDAVRLIKQLYGIDMEQMQYSMEILVEKAVKRYTEGGREPLFLLLEDIQDPGNLGTMLRTGEGAGVDGVIMSRGTVDIYNPKTIRSTMGSLYRVPFAYVEELADAIRLLQKNDIPVYAAHLRGERFFDELSYEGGSAFLIGNEGNGLKKETADLADLYLKIPMEGKLESLNAAVASALLLYQASGNSRRRRPE